MTAPSANLSRVARVDELVDDARELVDAVLRIASDLLFAGIDPERVHRRYVTACFELAEEVERRGLLASEGDEGVIGRLTDLVRELRELRKEAKAELRDQVDREGGA